MLAGGLAAGCVEGWLERGGVDGGLLGACIVGACITGACIEVGASTRTGSGGSKISVHRGGEGDGSGA